MRSRPSSERPATNRRRLVGGAAALGLVTATAVGYTLHAATNPGHTIELQCTATVFGSPIDLEQTTEFIANGPDAATSGAAIDIVLPQREVTLPAEASGQTVNSYENLRSQTAVYGAAVTSATITEAGSHPASVDVAGNTVTVVIPGPLPAGSPFTTPEVTIALSVTAASGATTGLRPGDPFYQVTANTASVGAVTPVCNPADAQQTANATLTIPVGAPDSEPPSINFIEPNAASVYGYEEEVAAAFECSDRSTPVTCTGSTAAGEPLDTSTSGVREFSVTATDGAGNTITETIEYVVLPEGAPPPERPGFASLEPARVLDTRSGGVAATVDGEFLGQGKAASGTTVELAVAGRAGVPDDAVGVALTVTAADNEGAGHVTVYPCGQDRPLASNVNFAHPNDLRSNAVVAAVGDDGKVCVATFGAATHLVVDVSGYFPFGSRFVGLTPGRLLDTRPDHATVDDVEQDGASAADRDVVLAVAGRHNVPASATAALLNVTAISTAGAGHVTVYPCGTDLPIASNVNVTGPGEGAVANLVISKLGSDGTVCLRTAVTSAHLVVDVSGYLPAGAEYSALVPGRLLDTRADRPTVDGEGAGGGKPQPGTPIVLQVAGRHGVDSDASAAVLNVAAADADGPGYLKLFPCGTEPNASTVNFSVAGQTRANATLAKLSEDGTVCVVARPGSAHVVIDVAGFVPAQGATPPPPPPPGGTTTTTTTDPGPTPSSTEPGPTPSTTVPEPPTCLDQGVYDTTLALYEAVPNPLLLSVLQQLDPDGDGNACND